MSEAFSQLNEQFAAISRLSQAAALLGWDQQTQMPSGAASARGEQMAALQQVIHEKSTSEEIGELLMECEEEFANEDPDSADVRILRTARRNYDRSVKLPISLVVELARHGAVSHEAWVHSREDNDFQSFAPYLEKMFDLTRRKAECLGYISHIYDPLLDEYEPGMTHAETSAIFTEIKSDLVELAHSIANSTMKMDTSCIHGIFPVSVQQDLTLKTAQAIGFDTTRGRQDAATHPFCTSFSRDDVRITTRFDADFLAMALYATLHEAGHALYEQGSPPEFEETPLAGGISLGIHESQSRFWENIIGRSRSFARWIFPQLQQYFPASFSGRVSEEFYRAVNQVQPSTIRVEADEVTYNLHILLRFELECALLEGSLKVRDLPEAWNQKMQDYLGISPPNDSQGCLQDIHWAEGLIGYFPTYSIGNLLSGQIRQAMLIDLPGMEDMIEKGDFSPLLEWLRKHIHCYAGKYLPGELIPLATGSPLSSKPYMNYLREKYTELYQL